MEALISAGCAIGGFVLCYLAFFRNTKKDCTEDGKTAGAMMSELGYIKANTDDIKSEQKEQRKINIDLYSRLSEVESSSKSAHKRIDDMAGRKDLP